MADEQPYDYKHMKATLDSLMVAWAKNPYQRFGQLLMNMNRDLWVDGAPDLFNIKDDVLAKKALEYSEV